LVDFTEHDHYSSRAYFCVQNYIGTGRFKIIIYILYYTIAVFKIINKKQIKEKINRNKFFEQY